MPSFLYRILIPLNTCLRQVKSYDEKILKNFIKIKQDLNYDTKLQLFFLPPYLVPICIFEMVMLTGMNWGESLDGF